MALMERRRFLQAAAAAAAWSASAQTKMRLGLIISIRNDPDAAIKRVRDFGLPTCQLHPGGMTDADAAKLRKALDDNKVEATTAVFGGPGPAVYDFYQGPQTIGLVPRQYRAARIAYAKEVSDFAKKAGIPSVQSHCGF